jgi:acetyltransferase
VLTPQQQTPVEKIAEVIIAAKKNNEASIIAVFIGGERTKDAVSYLKRNNIPNFANPDSAVDALDKYYQWNVFRQNKTASAPEKISAERKKQVAEIISTALAQKRGALLFPEAAEIVQLYGINCVKSYTIMSGASVPEIAEYPVVVKIDSDKVLHKSDKQALILDIKDKESLLAAVAKLQSSFPGEQLVVQPMQEKQAELILGIKKDDIFGPVIVYGLGGIYTEVFKMVDFLIPPMGADDVKNNILKGKLGFLFQGARGQAAYDIDEFAGIVSGLTAFALENGQVREFDINPLFIYNDKHNALAVDVKIII